MMSKLFDKVSSLAHEIPLDEYGRTYRDALSQIDPSDEKAIRTQAAYIASNAHPRTDEEKKALAELHEIAGVTVDREIIMERISNSFERFTEGKVRSMPKEEDIWNLEDAQVLTCTGAPAELQMERNACYHMDKSEYETFKKLTPETQKKVRILAGENILFDAFGVFAVPPSTEYAHYSHGFRYNDYVDKFCRENNEKWHDEVACKIEGTVTGKIEGKPYFDPYGEGEWRTDHLRADIKKDTYWFTRGEVMSPEERDRKVKSLYDERDRYKVNRDDFRRFSEAYNYAYDDVLEANPWVKDVLADDVLKDMRKKKVAK